MFHYFFKIAQIAIDLLDSIIESPIFLETWIPGFRVSFFTQKKIYFVENLASLRKDQLFWERRKRRRNWTAVALEKEGEKSGLGKETVAFGERKAKKRRKKGERKVDELEVTVRLREWVGDRVSPLRQVLGYERHRDKGPQDVVWCFG